MTGSWPGGFQGDVKVTNTGTGPVNGWTLKWTYPSGQQIAQLWNGTVTQSGSAVTVTNTSWNGALAPGGSASFGFLASWTTANPLPTAFTLNTTPCTTL